MLAGAEAQHRLVVDGSETLESLSATLPGNFELPTRHAQVGLSALAHSGQAALPNPRQVDRGGRPVPAYVDTIRLAQVWKITQKRVQPKEHAHHPVRHTPVTKLSQVRHGV
jgi:hypothetical protein